MSALCDPPGAASPPRPPLSPQELSQELQAFLSGSEPGHARRALLLLRTLPPARHAALERLRSLFDEQVCSHLLESETGTSENAGGNETIREVRAVLGELVRYNPAAWAPAVAAWASDLLGQLSGKYAGRRGVPRASELTESLRLWTACEATRALLEMYAQCLAAMIGARPDACVAALLDTCVRHAPHFDWVVAHVGSAFPATIINRVLACGLRDFADGAGTAAAPKMASVVGILSHLAARHSGSIKQELFRIFRESLTAPPPPHHKAAVPFLLHLAAASPPVLAAISPELVDSLPPAVLNQLQLRFQAGTREEAENASDAVVRLLCQISAGAYRLLQFLLDVAMPASVITPPAAPPPLHAGVREACDRLLQLLLFRLQKSVYERAAPENPENVAVSPPPPRCVPFLEALKPHARDLCAETLRMERKRYVWQHRLLALLAAYAAARRGDAVGAESLAFLLTAAGTPEELGLAAQLHAGLVATLPRLLPAALHASLRQIHAGFLPEKATARFFRNLAAASRWEAGEGSAAGMAAQLAAVLPPLLPDFARLLLHRDAAVAESVCFLLSGTPFPFSLPPSHLLVALRAGVRHFFGILRRRGADADALWHAGRLLTRLSAVSPAAAKAALQLLVEAALRDGNAELFGGKAEKRPEKERDESRDASLLDINRRFAGAGRFSGGVWSVFHAGVIGKGLKIPPEAENPPPPEEPERNTHVFLTLLLRCSRGCRSGESPSEISPLSVHPEAAKAVAAALVENVCPEAAAGAGELVWPPEEQTRGTVERDLRICRIFQRQPLLFPLFRLVAAGKPALCYCSVLLRGLLAALLAHWEACREFRTTGSPWQLAASCFLVSCMAEGALLPPVFGNIPELFPRLAPFEVRLLLLSVWEYLRENGPLPQKFLFHPRRGVFLRDFSRDADGGGKHLAVLHSVLHKNIGELGALAGRFRP